MSIPKLLTPDEVSNILGVGKNTLAIWRCTDRYPLRWVKVGRLVRYREEDVLAFIERQTMGSPEPTQD